MIKLIYPEANEQLLNQCEGLMTKVIFNEKADKNIKEASSNSISRELLSELKPDKDHFAIHFIGVGDYEKYGFNKNADAFPKLANEKYYDTFEKKAHLFREHKSDNPDVNAIGVIKKAAYNPEMGRIEIVAHCNIKKAAEEYEKAKSGGYLSCSMGCFPKDTLITVADGAFKPIQEIKQNDIIYTGNSLQKVTNTISYNYTGDITSIKVSGLIEKLIGTCNHPVFVRRYKASSIKDIPHEVKTCPVCGVETKYLRTHLVRSLDDKAHKDFWENHQKDQAAYEEFWTPIQELRIGDYIKLPKFSYTTNDIITESLAKFLGYFCAEGNFIKYRGKNPDLMKDPFSAVQLNFHKDETEYINDVVKCLQELVPNKKPTVQIRDKKNLTVISLYDKDFATKIYKLCGEYSYAKVLSSDVMQMSDDCIKAFLDAYVKGDGNYNKANEEISWTTCSRLLAYQVQQLFLRVGIMTRYTASEAYVSFNTKTGKEVAHRKAYTGIISSVSQNKAASFLEKGKEKIAQDASNISEPFLIEEDQALYRKVIAIASDYVTDYPVFNFEVENEHQYVANNILVHNCSVPNDRDSITGQLSKTPAEYSDYMRKRAGQYIPEHKKYAFVYNDEPTFFDLSIVKRPAERIAHALEYKFASDNTKDLLKTASDNNACIPSALLAEMAGIKYSLNTDLTDTKKIATLKKLEAIEKDVSDIIFNKSRNDDKAIYVKNAAINSYSKHDELSKLEIANLLDTGVKGETVFRELAKRASVLPFKSFVDLIFPKETEAKSKAIKLAACSMLPSIFESLPTMGINLSALENLFDSGSALDCISDNGDSDPVQKFMDQAAERFSVEEEPRSKRIIKITIINNSSKPLDISDILPQIIKSASEGVFAYDNEVYNKAVKYSTAYALYKIAAINDIEKFRGKELDDSELYALIAQNYIYNI